MTLARAVMLALAATVGVSGIAGAQRPGRPGTLRPTARDTVGFARDSAGRKRDTLTTADTASRANLAEPDSTMRRLLALPGYSARVYQAETLTFDALSRGICLATRATIASGDTLLLKSNSICSAGAGNRIRVGSDTARGRNVIRLPGQNPIFNTGTSTYDVSQRRAVVNRVSTSLEQSGQTLQVAGERIVIVQPPKDSVPADSALSSKTATFYLRDGTITACTDSVPDYHFSAGEIKRTGSFIVARPATLYIGDVPVFWLPFLFQDVRGGRHSGILAPNVGVSDIVRNNKSYRRNVDGLGYYFALSDYVDAQGYLDWRSNAGQADLYGDQGYTRYTGEVRYNWLERYVNGRLALNQLTQGNQQSRSISFDHRQEFTRNSSLNATYNYTTNTFLQRQTAINPYQVSSAIRSSANYAQKVGPLNFTLGGTQTQYPGRTQLERNFPSLNLSTSPLDIGNWLVWTPSLTYSSSQTLRIDQVSAQSLFLTPRRTSSGLDSLFGDTLRRNSYTSSLSLGTPIQLFGYQIGNQITVASRRADFLQREDVTDVVTGVVDPRFYASTFETAVDWQPSFQLPALARNNFNLSAGLSLSNVDPSAFAIRNHRTNGEWVHQSKRPTFSLSASPTLFGLFGGFGPYSRIRHSITPVVSYSYAPARGVSNQFLAATGRSKYSATTGDTTGYLGGLATNSLSFQLSTNVEAKSRSRNDSNPEAGDKVKLVSLNFSALTYDFERARATHSPIRGLTSDAFNFTVTSDLLPGFNASANYSLFEGSTLSDSARFRPFFLGVNSSFSFSNTANPFAVLYRLFGGAVPLSEPPVRPADPTPDDRYAREVASQPIAGRASARGAYLPARTDGWKASFTFSSQRQRPPRGGNVVDFDPSARCLAQFPGTRFQLGYQQCVSQALTTPATETAIGSGLAGSTIYRYQNTTSLGSDITFNLTEHWSASYTNNYDFERHAAAMQVVSLQRDLHDWRAIFGFTQNSNGAFSFNFLVSLKAEPELKFDYRKSTYRGAGY